MDWAIHIAITLLVAALVALVAREVARRIACAGGDPGAGVLLMAIVISLVVLQGAAKLAVLIEGAFASRGIDPEAALGGNFAVMAYAASFVPIAAYVVTFLMVYRKNRAKG